MQRQVNAPTKLLDRWSGRILGRALGGLFRAFGLFGRTGPVAPPRRILAIKFCCMGDAVLVVPALRALRQSFPQAHITMLCTPRTIGIFQDCRYLDEVILFKLGGSSKLVDLVREGMRALARTLPQLRSPRFDVAIDFDDYYNWTTFVGFATGAPVRVGFDPIGQGRRFLLTHPVPHSGDRHMVEFFLDLARAVGADTADKSIAIELTPGIEAWAVEYLASSGLRRDGKPVVIISPGRGEAWHFIRWPEEKFAATAESLHRRHGAHVLLMGGQAEAAIAGRIGDMLSAREVTSINLVAKTNLQQTEAVMRQADLLVCNDSGPMHVGTAMGVPTLAIFGPTNMARWGPFGPGHRVVRLDLDCSPCTMLGKLGKCPRQYLECLGVSVEAVVQAADEMLDRRRAEFSRG